MPVQLRPLRDSRQQSPSRCPQALGTVRSTSQSTRKRNERSSAASHSAGLPRPLSKGHTSIAPVIPVPPVPCLHNHKTHNTATNPWLCTAQKTTRPNFLPACTRLHTPQQSASLQSLLASSMRTLKLPPPQKVLIRPGRGSWAARTHARESKQRINGHGGGLHPVKSSKSR